MSFWQKWGQQRLPSTQTASFPTSTLPFFAVENTSLNLQAVARMANILVHCTCKTCHPNNIVLQCYSAPIIVTVVATERVGRTLTFSVSVHVNKISVVNIGNLQVAGNTYTAAAQVCGIIYRKAVVLAPLTSQSTFAASKDPSARLITSSWPPVRIVSLATTLFMQTFNGAFGTATVVPRTVASMVVRLEPKKSSMLATNLHIEYKARSVAIVITCKSPPQKSVHSIPYPSSLQFTLCEYPSFRWKNTVANNRDLLQLHTQQLWRLVVGILT